MGGTRHARRVGAELQTVVVDPPITLGQFVKLAGLAATGGEAKELVSGGQVRVNAQIETRRGHHLADGDVVEADGREAWVVRHARGFDRPKE